MLISNFRPIWVIFSPHVVPIVSVNQTAPKRFTTSSTLHLQPRAEDDYKEFSCEARHKALPPDVPMRAQVQLSVLCKCILNGPRVLCVCVPGKVPNPKSYATLPLQIHPAPRSLRATSRARACIAARKFKLPAAAAAGIPRPN